MEIKVRDAIKGGIGGPFIGLQEMVLVTHLNGELWKP